MARSPNRTYRIAEFAVLAGVTSRALRHYERLGLLRPKRSNAGYRLYVEQDLETLEEIVALSFIGVPLKEIAILRRRSRASLAERLRAQRQILETKRGTLTRAISALSAAQAALDSGREVDVQLFRHIIEVMQMDANHEETVTNYVEMLKAKMTHISALSPEARAQLRSRWSDLAGEIRASVSEDPAGPKAQALLTRWIALLQAMTGADASQVLEAASLEDSARVSDSVLTRRAEWLPAGQTTDTTDVEAARARVQDLAKSLADHSVLEFLKRARAARR
jgi:DNA-binding transcriptional MerR regulator